MSTGPRLGGDDTDLEDIDVMTSDTDDGYSGHDPTDDDDDGEDWNANEMAGEGDDAELEAADGEEDEEAEAEGEEGQEGDDEGDGEEVEPIDPPANWPEEVREAFAAIPPHLQHWYVNNARHMQADYTRKTQALASERQQYQRHAAMYAELDKVTAPYEQQWALNGMNKAQAVSQLIALSNFATSDPQGFIQYFANLRGVDLQSLNGEQEYIDPQVAALRQPLSQVQAQLNQMQQRMEQEQQQQQYHQYQSAFQSVNASIDEFAQRRGQDGRPLYPYINDVMGEMADLIETRRARSMDEAYKIAIRMNPSTYAKELARFRASENAKVIQRAEKARRAASSLSGASGANGAFAPRDMSIRDTINAAMDGSL